METLLVFGLLVLVAVALVGGPHPSPQRVVYVLEAPKEKVRMDGTLGCLPMLILALMIVSVLALVG